MFDCEGMKLFYVDVRWFFFYFGFFKSKNFVISFKYGIMYVL